MFVVVCESRLADPRDRGDDVNVTVRNRVPQVLERYRLVR
jgi:hypothetical protein